MEYQYINVRIDQTGKIFLEVDGVSGKKCVALTKELEETLGELLKRDFKPEYYNQAKENDNFLTVGL